ncbi:MAG: VWA domain-containing protein [Deltaproteobacteria bacterium]|nr:VWA domain-containing protein [Deltaproteobacteria bacterium]
MQTPSLTLPTLSLITLSALAGAAACSSDDAQSFTTAGSGGGGATTGAMSSSSPSSAASGAGGEIFQPVGAGGSGGSEACAKSVTEGKLQLANILFVIDRSGSMNCNPPPTQSSSACELNPTTKDVSKPTRWNVVSDALKATFAKMPATASVGIAYLNNDDNCGVGQQPAVPLAPLSPAQITALGASIDGVKPKGATPIIGAVTLGYKHLFEDVKFPGNAFVVLLTDGAETCAPQLQEKLVKETVPLAASLNIRTFVIGAPGSDPARALLSQIAWAGGTSVDPQCKHDATPANVGDCHFDMTDPSLDFAKELNTALEAISGTALTCELDVPSAVGEEVDYDKVNVTYSPTMGDDVPLLQDSKPCGSANGWQYSADKKKILLCGPTCSQVKSDPSAAITIELGCATMVAK